MNVDRGMPVDSDVDLHVLAQRRELAKGSWPVLAAISAGGAIGALARWGLGTAFPSAGKAFPWTTFAINVTGCLLIGILMVLITERWEAHRLVRPFLGVGVLGGFTTFSAYVVEIRRLVAAGAPGTALTYLASTVLAAVLATYAGIRLTKRVTRTRVFAGPVGAPPPRTSGQAQKRARR